MTDIGSSRLDSSADTPRATYVPSSQPSGWTGWVVFAGFMMLLNGFIQGIEGFIGLFNSGYYHVTRAGLAINVDYKVWGVVHLLLGLAVFAAGLGVLVGNTLARIVGVVLAGFNALVALVFIEAAPIWGIVLITVDVLVIYALIVHGRELRDSRR
jgi:hypothetical protein